ncbi:MAG TPA: PAS domain S-box protein [Polyangiaceae bacterium]|nr:PAS domain S-box protein [Polyangiaceae bacterium]
MADHCERPLQALVELTRFLASSQDLREALQAVIRCITDSLDVQDCRIILAREGDAVGHLAAASTAPDSALSPAGVDLEAYPEIEQVLSTGETLVTHLPVAGSPVAASQIAGGPGPAGCLAVVPIGFDGAPQGVLYVLPRSTELTGAQRSLLELIANAAAMTLRNAQMSESLSYEKRMVSLHRARVEHRIKFFQRYADFFESAADGMVVVDHAGRILFSNPRASEISGYSNAELDGAGVLRFLSRREIGRAAKIVRGFRAGVYPRGVDIRFIPKAARAEAEPRELILNVTFSPVLRAERAVLFMFRDVTLERATEVELRRTKEFLERVIDSSVDAIVSADLTGRVLLFNRAAARIFGYEPNEVIGKLNVERLYPSGVARQVMRHIRSPGHGGARRLEDYRVDMMGSRGETIPVKLSAALIMEGERAIGSVGVFTDIREQLRMESSLQTAQEELREREKGLALAELAGTTAHELNQPLTAVIGYAELMLRQLPPDAEHRPAAEVIHEQAQRMAQIVQKIGKITRYETRSYVGAAKILDLDKAAPEEE